MEFKMVLESFKIDYLELDHLQKSEDVNSSDSSMFSYYVSAEKSSKIDQFNIVFNFEILNFKESYKLRTKSVATFLLDIPTDEELVTNSDFAKINAPAIAFPYLRTFLSNLTLNSGFNSLILPTLNFVRLSKSEEEE